MPSDEKFSEERIEKMLEQARTRPVPPEILGGFKDGVMRRIAETQPLPEAGRSGGPRSGRWFASGFRLPRMGLTVGAGALSCLLIASLAVLTLDRPPRAARPEAAPLSVRADFAEAVPRARASDTMAPGRLTVEEELRLIEEFDDRRFFIRQDITEDEPASA